jgi:hypothetical protein
MKKPPFNPRLKELQAKMDARAQQEPQMDEITIPVTDIEPINRRIYVIRHEVGEVKRKQSNIIVPDYISSQNKHGQEVRIPKFRYYVVSVAKDCTLTFTDKTLGEERKLRRGDEIYLPFIEGADRYTVPQIFDHMQGGMPLLLIEQTEVIGIMSIPAVDMTEIKRMKQKEKEAAEKKPMATDEAEKP